MASVRIKRGTRAQLNAAAASNGLLVGQEYLITDEGRVAVGTSASTYQAMAKEGEGGGSGGLSGLATITLPPKGGVIEWTQTVAAVGVTPSMRILAGLAPHDDADENDAEMLDLRGLSARSGTDEITFVTNWGSYESGPIKLNWSAF